MSDLLQSTSSSSLPAILISKISLRRGPNEVISEVEWAKLRPPSNMPMPAGACRYQNGILYCSQGTQIPDSGGLCYMPSGKPPIPFLTSYFHKPFNSIQNVVEDTDGGLWFTDTSIGFEQEIRPKPQLPNQVYRYDPKTEELRVVADGFVRPTGIALGGSNADETTLYITDTGAACQNKNSYLPGYTLFISLCTERHIMIDRSSGQLLSTPLTLHANPALYSQPTNVFSHMPKKACQQLWFVMTEAMCLLLVGMVLRSGVQGAWPLD